MIPVTIPYVPPLEEYHEILRGVWDRRILTHNGPLVQELEAQLCRYLGISHMVALTNGTIALQLAIRALKLRGEIITTPFTWIATASAIVWEGCTPIFADINPNTFNIDPAEIERRITPRTVAIMPVHVFSRPCDTDAIAALAEQHKLKVIYDAAHAFSVTHQSRSILEYGDISCTSFHATKLFNTAEGGGCTSLDGDLIAALRRLRFFGHDDQKNLVDDGMNGKMTEVHAALGLANLIHLDQVRRERRRQYERYLENLQGLEGLRFQDFHPEEYNYSYMPVVLSSPSMLLSIEQRLTQVGIMPRRYFYPSLNTVQSLFPYSPQPRSEDIASRILCLPLYFGLSDQDLDRTSEVVREAVKGSCCQ
jgi:dTDP-4-amino-4,6-dideoxygalactose transaminase